MFIKILFISTFIFFSSCKPFMTTGGNSGNTSPNPGGPGAPIKPATCAAITDLSKCATAQPQDSTDCAVNHTGLLCVVLPKTCAEILIKEDCPYLKAVCEWQAGNCVNKPGVPPPPPPPPPGDPVKKDELIESITNNPAFDEADLDKFASLDEAQLKDVLTEITKKDPAYKKDLMTKILAENKLNNFIKADQLDDAFIAAFKTADKKDYAFSNALLDAALKDGSGVSKKVQKDVVKKVFEREDSGQDLYKGYSPPKAKKTKLGTYALVVDNDIVLINNKVPDEKEKAKKDEIGKRFAKIFSLGPEAVDDFYDYIEPQTWTVISPEKMNPKIGKAIIKLILEKDLLKEIVRTPKHAQDLLNILHNADGFRKFDNDLSLEIKKKMVAKLDDYTQEVKKFVETNF